MKQRLIETGHSLLVTQLNHWILVAAAITVFGLFDREQPQFLFWMVVGILPAILYMIRAKVGNFFLFFLLHLILPMAAVIYPMEVLKKIILVAIVIIYVIWSVSIRIRNKQSSKALLPPPVAIGVIGVTTLIENLYSKQGWEGYYILLAILYLSGYFVQYFVTSYLYFLVVNESSAAGIPEREIFTSGMRQTAWFTVGGILVLVATANIGWLSYIMSWIGQGLLILIRLLISLLSKKAPEEVEEEIFSPQQPGMDMGMLQEGGETSLFWLILEKIFIVLAVGVLAAMVILAVVVVFRFLWKSFYAVKKAEVQKLQKGRDIREVCEIERNTKEAAASWFSFLNNRDKVRKVYRKQILKNKGEIIGNHNTEVLEYMTAKECCERIPMQKEQSDLLKNVYEKARYSQMEITAEDVRKMKSSTH